LASAYVQDMPGRRAGAVAEMDIAKPVSEADFFRFPILTGRRSQEAR
jgi:hypothetical protein